MRRQEEEALRRLEQALLEDIPDADDTQEDSALWEDEYYEEIPDDMDDPYTGHDADQTDMDPEEYGEKRGGCLIPGLITLLALSVLTAMVMWLLRYLGVM